MSLVPIALSRCQVPVGTYRSTAPPRASSTRNLAVTPQFQPIKAFSSVSGDFTHGAYLRHSAQLRAPSFFWPLRESDDEVDSEADTVGLALGDEESMGMSKFRSSVTLENSRWADMQQCSEWRRLDMKVFI
jgi:hypothetical protein